MTLNRLEFYMTIATTIVSFLAPFISFGIVLLDRLDAIEHRQAILEQRSIALIQFLADGNSNIPALLNALELNCVEP